MHLVKNFRIAFFNKCINVSTCFLICRFSFIYLAPCLYIKIFLSLQFFLTLIFFSLPFLSLCILYSIIEREKNSLIPDRRKQPTYLIK